MSALIRARRRRTSAGFTLIELMVVVMLISILAVMAIPRMSGARDDRLCFDYARQIAGLIHRARTRAIGRGAAHMVVLQAGAGGAGAGQALLFEALDGVPATAAPPGPNPLSSCRAAATVLGPGGSSWAADINTWLGAPGAVGNNGRFIEMVDLNVPGIPTQSGIAARVTLAGVAAQPVTLYCVTPYGATYVASGADVAAAVDLLVAAQPFTNVLEVTVRRGVQLGAPVGLARRIVVASGAAPRIHSQ